MTRRPEPTHVRGEETAPASADRTVGATLTDRGRPGPDDASWPQGHIGRYQIETFVGSGGMGIVFAVRDPELDRRLGVKLLHPETYGPEARGELLREARALARINHPNVLTVTDVGEHEGRTFLAMELVDGPTVRTWLEAEPRSLAEIVEVFSQAARGLAAAHAAGVVHRDFKPSNMLLDGTGRVRVMDFGLARTDRATAEVPAVAGAEATALDDETLRGSVSGTPAYMAPEQHLCEAVDGRTDQFAFCVALYEALYGERPFPGQTLAQIALSVTTAHVRPAPRNAQVPRALRAVLLRGLQREQDARFPNMDALRKALHRATGPSPTRLVAGIVAVGVVAGGLLVAVLVPAGPRCDANVLARSLWSPELADELRSSIEVDHDAWRRIATFLDEHARRWGAARFEACREMRRGERANLALDARIHCLEDQRRDVSALLGAAATSGADELLTALNELPLPSRCAESTAAVPPPEQRTTPQTEAVRERLSAARALGRLGKYEEAERLVVELTPRAAEASDPSLPVEVDLVLAGLLERRGALSEAEKIRRRAYFAAIDLGDDATAGTAASGLASLVGADLHRPDEGQQWAAHARAALARAPSTAAEAHLATSVGTIYRAQGDLERAQRELERALELRSRELGPDHLAVADSMNNLAGVLMRQQLVDEPVELYERVVAIRKERLGQRHPSVARALSGLGGALYGAGKYGDALAAYSEALEILEGALGADDISVARVLNNRGDLHGNLGHFDDAIADLRRALEIFRRVRGDDAPEAALVLDNLGLVLADKGDYTGAIEHHQRALATLETIHGPVHPRIASVLNNLGNAQDFASDRTQARASYEQALEVLDALDAPPIHKAGAISNLGLVCNTLGDRACALQRTREALRLREDHFGPDHPEVAISLVNLANLISDRGDLVEARALLHRALKISESASGKDAFSVSHVLQALAFVEARRGDWAAAETHLRRTLEIREAAGASPEAVAQARFYLAKAQWALGHRAEARRNARTALETFEQHELDAWLPDVRAWLRKPTPDL